MIPSLLCIAGYLLGIRLWSKFRCWMISVRWISPKRAAVSLDPLHFPHENHWVICCLWPVALLAFLVAAAIRYEADAPEGTELERAVEAGKHYVAPIPRRGEGGGVEQLPLPSRREGG